MSRNCNQFRLNRVVEVCSFTIFIHLENFPRGILSFFQDFPHILSHEEIIIAHSLNNKGQLWNWHSSSSSSHDNSTSYTSSYFLILLCLIVIASAAWGEKPTCIQYKSDNKPSSHRKRLKENYVFNSSAHHHLKWTNITNSNHLNLKRQVSSCILLHVPMYQTETNPHYNLCLMFDSENSTNHRKYSAPCPFVLIWHFGK